MSKERNEAYRKLRKLKKIKRKTKGVPEKWGTYVKTKKAIRKIKEQFEFE